MRVKLKQLRYYQTQICPQLLLENQIQYNVLNALERLVCNEI